MSGLLIAAPSSGSGKTTITFGLLRALKRRGVTVNAGKAGPDYIDPAFHAIASGGPCVNFDPWAMRPELLLRQASSGPLIIEAMMGLFDSAADGVGSPAHLAKMLGLNVVFVVDCGRMSQSVGALVRGYATHDPDVRIAGLILNRVGSPRHERLLRNGLEGLDIPILGVMPSDKQLSLPERHLGLVQAGEIGAIDAFMDYAAERVAERVDLDALLRLAQRPTAAAEAIVCRIPPLGQRIAVARDEAFAFSYPHLLDGWRAEGAEIRFFSPLADEAPDEDADAVYLPGGYPELHAGRLAAAARFKAGMATRAAAGAVIYGECGGYMALGEGLIDAEGRQHEMLGLLPLVTTFAERKRHLGYRRARALSGPYAGVRFNAHEFHYSKAAHEGEADRLFAVSDAEGTDLGAVGLTRGNVSGSYMHLIDLGSS
ncbi:cobyrinic acid a,c-diamide synthase [Rhizobium sp. SG_E_25_P2]|uniref:cobyrinate a,c-diamide synthase n=1 Tax=Rhizobium sp. SG_E_25_P2 TaxID=2879942 RepID=UPI0024742F64|nr:cobyrinate a,c-diamide synthase [Rhizobium sp. SG_E_25_P2]MDH6267279.1 cobyrinic acid a,c-diamide synthase [Rhizobium sp. SG_E_25_P2]